MTGITYRLKKYTDMQLYARRFRNITSLNSNLTTHKSSGDHDGRYYTKSAISFTMSWPISRYYTGNGSTTNRSIKVSILSTVYNGFVSYGIGSNIRGINGNHKQLYSSSGTNFERCKVLLCSFGTKKQLNDHFVD